MLPWCCCCDPWPGHALFIFRMILLFQMNFRINLFSLSNKKINENKLVGVGLKVCFSVSSIWRKLPLLYWVFSPLLNMLQLVLHLFESSNYLSIVAFGAVSMRTNGICLLSQSQKGASERYMLRRRLRFWAGFPPIILGWGSLKKCAFAYVGHK